MEEILPIRRYSQQHKDPQQSGLQLQLAGEKRRGFENYFPTFNLKSEFDSLRLLLVRPTHMNVVFVVVRGVSVLKRRRYKKLNAFVLFMIFFFHATCLN